MSDDDFGGRGPREDLDSDFPAAAMELRGPAFLGDSGQATAALVAAYLLRSVRLGQGARVRISDIDGAITRLEAAVPSESRNLCRDEARRIARWCAEPPEPQAELLDRDRSVLRDADHSSKIAIVNWALTQDLDVELEYYDETEERWPRLRASPVRVFEEADETLLEVRTAMALISIPVANLRWLMPVERHKATAPPLARVLSFPNFTKEE